MTGIGYTGRTKRGWRWRIVDYSTGRARTVASGFVSTKEEAQDMVRLKLGIRRKPRKPGTLFNARTIELAPKWKDVVVWIMRVLEDRKAPERSKAPLREELLRLASEMDKINEEVGRQRRSPTLFNRRRR